MILSPVILAGGGGTRLWPLSREYYPKQFLRLFGEKTLLQNTLARIQWQPDTFDIAAPLIICNEVHRFLVLEQCSQQQCNPDRIILEPKGRNTAPALTIAALSNASQDRDSVMVMMPADHVIQDIERFRLLLQAGYELALQDRMVTFGIRPDRPETGYGYIHAGVELALTNNFTAFSISTFTEKPDSATASSYLADGDYFWNSGIFMMKASVWLEQIQSCNVDIYESCGQAFNGGSVDGAFYRLQEVAFLSCPNDSIDYAVMEKVARSNSDKLALIPVEMGWSDVGVWSSVWDLSDKDAQRNYLEGDVTVVESSDCYVKSSHRLVSLVGCHNLVIVDSDDAVLIANKDSTQEIKHVVAGLKQHERDEALLHRKVFRPWGSYDSIEESDTFKVKRIIVNPGKKLSLQKHHHRAEHWVVVKGTAIVTKDEAVFELKENESTFIPVGARHRLENPSGTPLEIIEVQSGAYLGEDDIVRFEDDFGRG